MDFGLIRLWSGEGAPHLQDWMAPPEIVARANASSDYEVVGPDADAVARRLDLAAVKGRFGFDLPEASILRTKVQAICERDGSQAEVVPISRMPHLERLRRLLAASPGGAEVPFFGLWGVAVRGVPSDRSLPVLGRRMDPDGPDAGRWHSVWVECGSGPPVSSVAAGHVLVDEARLLFADPAVLGAWRTDEPIDGLVDVVFWGRDEDSVAERMAAPTVDDGGGSPIFGWVDQPMVEAAKLVERLEALPTDGLVFRIDVRPHDDHHRLLRQARRAPTGAGVVDVAGQSVTGFFTSWGDGAFPVYRDIAADGTLVRVRVELGAPEIVSRTRRFDELWFGELSKRALVSARVARDGLPIGWLYREAPDREEDSGWRVFAGDESDAYANDADNVAVVPLRDLVERHPEIERLLATPAPASFERSAAGSLEAAAPPDVDG